MKLKVVAIAIFTILSLNVYSQKPLSQAAIKDFSKSALFAYTYNVKNFQGQVNVYFIYTLNKKSSDAAVAIEDMATNVTSREYILQSFDHQITRVEDVLFNYLYNHLGMKAGTAKEVTLYIREKYKR